MLSFFTYPQKLTAELRRLGYQSHDMPITREWIGLIHEFRKAGYSPERAAAIIDAAFARDPEALADACAIGGVYAIAIFGVR
jgi:hypothetical protein